MAGYYRRDTGPSGRGDAPVEMGCSAAICRQLSAFWTGLLFWIFTWGALHFIGYGMRQVVRSAEIRGFTWPCGESDYTGRWGD